VRLFADATIVYLTIKSHASAQSIQDDLHNLEHFEKEWSMELTLTSVKFSENTGRTQLSIHTHFITPPSEPQNTQNISGSLSLVTYIGNLT